MMFITPLLNKLDTLAFTIWGISVSSLTYVDDLHTIAIDIEVARQ